MRSAYSKDRYSPSRLAEYPARLDASAISYRNKQISEVFEPELYRALSDVKTSVEIGTADGLCIEKAAGEFPHISFTGIDFCCPKSRRANLAYIEGYALDEISNISADLLFARSTICLMSPSEYSVLLEPLKNFSSILISDPKAHDGVVSWDHEYERTICRSGFRLIRKRVDTICGVVSKTLFFVR